jgi:hypothetical protein
MREVTQVEQRIRDLLTEAFEERARALVETKLPHLCTYNHRQPLDLRRRVNGDANPGYNRITRDSDLEALAVAQTLGLCMYGAENPEQWPGNICEEPIDAQRCPLFVAKTTREALRKQFEEQIRDSEWVRVNMPEVHSLLWVLANEQKEPVQAQATLSASSGVAATGIVQEPAPEPAPTLPLNQPFWLVWWRRFTLWVFTKVTRSRPLPPEKR